jgi:hypothetical protein
MSVPVGNCAVRLQKLAGNFLCCKTFENIAPYWEEQSCLGLRKFYLEQTCKCAASGLTYSTDEALQDESLEAISLAHKTRLTAIGKGVPNPVIRKYIELTTRAADCINLRTLEELRTVTREIEALIGRSP